MHFWTTTFERRVTKIALWSFAIAFVYGLLPERIATDAFLGLMMTGVMIVLFLTLFSIYFVLLYRIALDNRGRYSDGHVLLVLLVPFFGALLVSLRQTAKP